MRQLGYIRGVFTMVCCCGLLNSTSSHTNTVQKSLILFTVAQTHDQATIKSDWRPEFCSLSPSFLIIEKKNKSLFGYNLNGCKICNGSCYRGVFCACGVNFAKTRIDVRFKQLCADPHDLISTTTE